jgi:hypothetical protein
VSGVPGADKKRTGLFLSGAPMSDWWADLPAPATAERDDEQRITAEAIAAERPAKPAKPTTADRLASYLLPQEVPPLCWDSGEPLRGLIAIARTAKHAEAIGEAAAVAGLRVEVWEQDAVAAVLRAAEPVAAVSRAFGPAAVLKRTQRAGSVPEDAIPFGETA